jgi:preprotein translocase subunit YajC
MCYCSGHSKNGRDRIVTTGGIIGTVTTVRDTSFLIRSADKSILEIARSAVAGIEGEEKK